jgi:hypothetical protein
MHPLLSEFPSSPVGVLSGIRRLAMTFVSVAVLTAAAVLAGCDANPNTASPTVSGANQTEGGVKAKNGKGEAKPAKNTDIQELIPRKDR